MLVGAGLLLGAGLAFLLLVVALFVGSGAGLMRWLAGRAGGQTVIVGQPTVVRQIQQLQRLETVVFKLDKIISGERPGMLPKFFTGDRILLLVHGEVVAGVDLGKLAPGDVEVNERTARLKLPPAEVFITRVDNQQTRVYSRDTGIFTSVDPNLETEVRREAERQLRQAALTEGILKTATQNARTAVTSLLNGLGFQTVEIE